MSKLWLKTTFLFLLILLSFGCSSTGSVVVPIDNKTVESIVNDPNIPAEAKARILTRFQQVNNQAIEVVGKKNLELQAENKELKNEIESDAWKVSLVDTIIKFLLFIFLLIVIYILFRFRKIFGIPF